MKITARFEKDAGVKEDGRMRRRKEKRKIYISGWNFLIINPHPTIDCF